MEPKEIIEEFRAQLDCVEAEGNAQLSVSAVRDYLSALEKDIDVSKELRTQQHEGMLAHYAAKSQHTIELFKAVLEAGKSALHSLLIINGGAVIALLGMMSNLVGKPSGIILAKYLALPLFEFGLGVLCGGLGFAFRYFSQACYSAPEEIKHWGDRFRYMAIFSAVAGYLLFGIAIFNSYHAVVWSFSS